MQSTHIQCVNRNNKEGRLPLTVSVCVCVCVPNKRRDKCTVLVQ